MVAGFLAALERRNIRPYISACVPFARAPLEARFPNIKWLPYDEANRTAAIATCDVWLGLGGSPFQSAQSRWFVDHLLVEAAFCRQFGKPMFYLGVGVQSVEELRRPEISGICRQARAIWTRDQSSADRLQGLGTECRISAGADLAHLFLERHHPPPPTAGSVAIVANFDYGSWPGQHAMLEALGSLTPRRRIWLAQETRELPGAEKALHRVLSESERAKWMLTEADRLGPLDDVVDRWPSTEWLVTSRFHAAIVAAWAGSKILVVATNEKLRGIAADLGSPTLSPSAPREEVEAAFARVKPAEKPTALAARAATAVNEFLRVVGM